MVREANISQEQVNAAADALRAAGVKPTVRAVRDKLGTGSQATVMRLLGVWKSNQVQASETPLTLPAPFQRVLVDYLAQTVAEEKQGLSAELAEQQQVNTDLGLENERLATQISALQSELAAIQSERDALVGRVQQLETDLRLARGEAEQERSAAAAVRVDLARAQLRLEAVPRLQEEITATENALDKERSARRGRAGGCGSASSIGGRAAGSRACRVGTRSRVSAGSPNGGPGQRLDVAHD